MRVGFLAALAKFGFDVAKHVFNVAFQASGCLIRSIALLVFLYLLSWATPASSGAESPSAARGCRRPPSAGH